MTAVTAVTAVTAPRTVHVVVPAGIDDPAAPSGGNAYDRRICRGLPATGWVVDEIAVAGRWPRPGPAARAALARVLDGLPGDALVLLDGLVACGVPDVVVPRADRLTMVVLVHLPLGEEAGGADLAAGERAVLHAARGVVATSPWTARRLVECHGLPADRVHVATPGVDPAPLARGTDGSTSLLCVGSITVTKGQDLLVAALAAVADLPFTCELVGPLHRDPGHVADVTAAITRHGLGERVRITGPLSGEPLAARFDAADLLVLPSRAEAYGMVLTEALARGIPVLATAVGGVPAALGEYGAAEPAMLVSPTAAALGGALRRWSAEPGRRELMRGAARERRHTLDGWEVTTRCLESVLLAPDPLPRPAQLCGTPA